MDTAKRRIQLSEKLKVDAKKRETFEQWLKRKRVQGHLKQSSYGSDADSSSDDNDDSRRGRVGRGEGGGGEGVRGVDSEAFKAWIKQLRQRPLDKPNPNSAASLHHRKSRAIQGLIEIGDTTPPESKVAFEPDTSAYMHTHTDWLKKKKEEERLKQAQNQISRGIPITTTTTISAISVVEKDKDPKPKVAPNPVTNLDVKAARKTLESKRSELLAMAISFDEWMSHQEEKKKLEKVIKRADKSKNENQANTRSKTLDNGEFTHSTNKRQPMTFGQWKQRTETKEAKLKLKNAPAKQQSALDRQMRDSHINSSSIPHEEWAKNKMMQYKLQQHQHQQQAKPSASDGSGSGNNEQAFDAWVNKKHKEEMLRLNNNGIRKEKQLLLQLREKKKVTIAASC